MHDEVVLLVPDDMDSITRIGVIAQREMVAAFREIFPNAPTLNLVEPKIGPNWGDLHFMTEPVIDAPNKRPNRGRR